MVALRRTTQCQLCNNLRGLNLPTESLYILHRKQEPSLRTLHTFSLSSSPNRLLFLLPSSPEELRSFASGGDMDGNVPVCGAMGLGANGIGARIWFVSDPSLLKQTYAQSLSIAFKLPRKGEGCSASRRPCASPSTGASADSWRYACCETAWVREGFATARV